MSGKTYDSFSEAVDSGKRGVTFPEGGCGAPIGICKRESQNPDDDDLYEPEEYNLQKAGLPELFFYDPENLVEEYRDEYLIMAEELWMGCSSCRFSCGVTEDRMGCRDLTDGVWAWPEGLAHYVEKHGVMLPESFFAHVEKIAFTMPESIELPSIDTNAPLFICFECTFPRLLGDCESSQKCVCRYRQARELA